MLPEVEADPSILKDEWWNYSLSHRIKQYNSCREHHGGVEFADYVNAVKRRLARHGFTRPFELKEDPKQQDNLSTWIEYLCFEYWWLDWYTDIINRLAPDYDKTWQKLTDSKVLRPHETQEYVPTDECGMRRDAEYHQAWDAWKRAQKIAEQVYTLTQLDPKRLSIPKAERCRMLEAASHKLQTANAWLSLIEKRKKLIHEYNVGTWSTRSAKKDVTRHRILLAWILEQIPLIEAKPGQTEAVQHGPGTAKKTKKRPYSNEDSSGEQDSKKRKLSCSGLSLRLESSAAVAAESEGVHKYVFDGSQRPHAEVISALCSSWTLATSETAPQGPRRSARIAARQMTAGTAPISQLFRRELRSRQQNKPNKAPRLLSTTETTYLSIIGSNEIRKNCQRNASKPQRVSKRSQQRR